MARALADGQPDPGRAALCGCRRSDAAGTGKACAANWAAVRAARAAAGILARRGLQPLGARAGGGGPRGVVLCILQAGDRLRERSQPGDQHQRRERRICPCAEISEHLDAAREYAPWQRCGDAATAGLNRVSR
jgi:hypothetical protein